MLKKQQALETLNTVTEIEKLFEVYTKVCVESSYSIQHKLTELYYKKVVELLDLQPIKNFKDINSLVFQKRWTIFNNSKQTLDYLNLAHTFTDNGSNWIEYTNGYVINRVLAQDLPLGCSFIVLGKKIYLYQTHIKHHTLVYSVDKFACQGKLNEYAREFQIVDGAVYNIENKKFSAMWVDNPKWYVHTSEKYVPVIISENEQWQTGNHRIIMPLGNR